MYGQLYAAPRGSEVALRVPSMSTQINLGFLFEKLKRTPDLVVQLIVGHGIEGEWPPLPGVLVIEKRP